MWWIASLQRCCESGILEAAGQGRVLVDRVGELPLGDQSIGPPSGVGPGFFPCGTLDRPIGLGIRRARPAVLASSAKAAEVSGFAAAVFLSRLVSLFLPALD